MRVGNTIPEDGVAVQGRPQQEGIASSETRPFTALGAWDPPLGLGMQGARATVHRSRAHTEPARTACAPYRS